MSSNSNLTKPRYLISYFSSQENDFVSVATSDLERALQFWSTAESFDLSCIFLKINADGYTRRIFYPEQLRAMKVTDEIFRDGWREFTATMHSSKAEAAINEIERQIELPGIPARIREAEKECEYCSGSGCRYCHFGEAA